MKPETKRRLWIFTALASLWLSSLFVWQTITADPRQSLHGVEDLEFLLCLLAVLLAIAAIVLHTRKSLSGLAASLIILIAAIGCLMNTQYGAMLPYREYVTPETDISIDGVGPAKLSFSDLFFDGILGTGVRFDVTNAKDIKDVRLNAQYRDLLGRYIFQAVRYDNVSDHNRDWVFFLPPCFSGKEIQIVIHVWTVDGKYYAQSVTVKVPKKPFWSK